MKLLGLVENPAIITLLGVGAKVLLGWFNNEEGATTLALRATDFSASKYG